MTLQRQAKAAMHNASGIRQGLLVTLFLLTAQILSDAHADSYVPPKRWFGRVNTANCEKRGLDPETQAQGAAACDWALSGRSICAWNGMIEDLPNRKTYSYLVTQTDGSCPPITQLTAANLLPIDCLNGGTYNGSQCATAPSCGEGQTRTTDGSCVTKPRCTDCPKTEPTLGNPIQSALANKYEIERDYVGASNFPLRFDRTYNSASVVKFNLGQQWRHSFDRVVQIRPGYTPTLVEVTRPDGFGTRFTQQGSSWVADADIADRLVRLSDSWGQPADWKYTVAADDSVETYDVAGQLLWVEQRDGRLQRLTYSTGTGARYPSTAPACTPPPGAPTPAIGLLWCVTDAFARQLNFVYDATNRLAKLVDPAGQQTLYSYNAAGYLGSVTYPDATVRTYHYNEAAHTAGANLPYALTGITDENGTRYATFKYDTSGRAVSTEYAGGVGKVTLSYASGSTTATDALNTSRTYTFETSLGVARNTGISQPCSASGCGGGTAAATTYDANGNASSRKDFNDVLTCYGYELSRNLPTIRAEGLTSAACPSDLST